ncbi:MAG: hypothetical protein NTX53_06700, partial [candidate division WOR-3 bacterium]|nr:hypothetical protein [candidate division WOR-3 bacterium]
MVVLKILGVSLGSFAVSWVGAYLMLKRAHMGAPMDVPSGRSSHTRSTVRGGGVGLALAVCLALLALGLRAQGVPRGDIGLFAIATVIIAAIGLWADYRDPPASYRLFLQLGAAGLVMGAGMQLQVLKLPWSHNVALYWAAVPLTLFWITAVTNLSNFIDGADGLATSVSIVYSSGIAAAAFATGHPYEGIVAFVVIAGCLGFLWFNFPPAKLFMGDVGSLTLGFVFAVLAIRLATLGEHPVPLTFFLILYSSFLFDTTYTIVYRATRGEKFWQAHRTHLYERLLLVGWSHLRVTLFYVGLSLVSLVLAFGYLRAGPVARTVIAGCQLLVCIGHVTFVKLLEKSEFILFRPWRRGLSTDFIARPRRPQPNPMEPQMNADEHRLSPDQSPSIASPRVALDDGLQDPDGLRTEAAERNNVAKTTILHACSTDYIARPRRPQPNPMEPQMNADEHRLSPDPSPSIASPRVALDDGL